MRNSERGVSVVEFMFSMAILTIVTLSSFFILTNAKQMVEDARYRVLALNAARSTLEQIKNTALANVSSVSTTSFVPVALPQGAITITTNPSPINAATVATVTVSVAWQGSRNRAQTLQVSTMRSLY